MAMKFKIKKKSKNKISRFFKRKIKENGGLFTAFAIGSILGFILGSINTLLQTNIAEDFMYVSAILGIGFMIEADIKRTFAKKNVRVLLPKMFTFLVGGALFVTGMLTIPFFNITYGTQAIQFIALMNGIAAFALIAEFLWVK